jgi:hypothetical protein
VERWIETRGYWRQRARNDDGQDQDTCKRQFEFAEVKLAECRAEMHGPGARLLALEAISAAIGRRLLSSAGERRKGATNQALGLLRNPEIAKRLDPEIREAILALFGGFAGLVKAMMNSDYGDASAIIADAARHTDAIEAALIELSGVAAATRKEKRQRIKAVESGIKSGRERRTRPESKTSAILAAFDQGVRKNEALAAAAQCDKSLVSRVLKKYRPTC